MTVLARAVVDLTGTITLGWPKAVTISQPGQPATVYTFSGGRAGLAIDITGSAIAGAALRFYRPNGTPFNGFGFGSGTTNLAITLDASGTWTVEIDPTGAYPVRPTSN